MILRPCEGCVDVLGPSSAFAAVAGAAFAAGCAGFTKSAFVCISVTSTCSALSRKPAPSPCSAVNPKTVRTITINANTYYDALKPVASTLKSIQALYRALPNAFWEEYSSFGSVGVHMHRIPDNERQTAYVKCAYSTGCSTTVYDTHLQIGAHHHQFL